MAISIVEERDRALGKVALQAASAGDLKSVTHALQEIRDSDLHDQTAADSALVLSKLRTGTSNAMEVAGLIRLTSLRDDTLSKLALGKPVDPSVEQASPTASPAKQE